MIIYAEALKASEKHLSFPLWIKLGDSDTYRIHFKEPMEYERYRSSAVVNETKFKDYIITENRTLPPRWKACGPTIEITAWNWKSLWPKQKPPEDEELFEIDLSGKKPKLVNIWIPTKKQ